MNTPFGRLARPVGLLAFAAIVVGPARAQAPPITPPGTTPPGQGTVLTPAPIAGIDDHSAATQPPGPAWEGVRLLDKVRSLLFGTNHTERVNALSLFLRNVLGASGLPFEDRHRDWARRFLDAFEQSRRPKRGETLSDADARAANLVLFTVDLRGEGEERRISPFALFLRNVEDLKSLATCSNKFPPPASEAAVLDKATVGFMKRTVRDMKGPLNLLTLSGSFWTSEREIWGAIPEVTYSNASARLDVYARPLLGDRNGFALGLRHELTRRDTSAQALRFNAALERVARDLDDGERFTASSRALQDFIRSYTGDLNDAATRWRFGVHAGYVDADVDVGTPGSENLRQWSMGGSASRLRPLSRAYATPGLLFGGSIQAVTTAFGSERSIRARFGARLGWQDRVPRVVREGNEDSSYYTHRWRWQYGLEAVTDEFDQDRTLYAVYFRHRIFPTRYGSMTWRQLLAQTTEVSGSIGFRSDGEPFFTMRLTHAFDF